MSILFLLIIHWVTEVITYMKDFIGLMQLPILVTKGILNCTCISA